jgi:hypothetical protein
MLPAMFTVTEIEAAATRTALEQRGEFAAAVELRRLSWRLTNVMGETDDRAANRRDN